MRLIKIHANCSTSQINNNNKKLLDLSSIKGIKIMNCINSLD